MSGCCHDQERPISLLRRSRDGMSRNALTLCLCQHRVRNDALKLFPQCECEPIVSCMTAILPGLDGLEPDWLGSCSVLHTRTRPGSTVSRCTSQTFQMKIISCLSIHCIQLCIGCARESRDMDGYFAGYSAGYSAGLEGYGSSEDSLAWSRSPAPRPQRAHLGVVHVRGERALAGT